MKKTKSKKINFTNLLTLVVIILTLLSIYLTVIYRAKPYLYIEDVQLISNGETIYGDIANGGNKTAKYITEITVKDIVPVIYRGTLSPGQTTYFTFPSSLSSLDEKINFNIKVKYSPIPMKDGKMNYCTEYNFRYEGTYNNPSIISGPTNCN